ncbi:MAG: PQQ-dependent sugar dehydrogenase [Desulfobulbaceae bacterium]|nr:PQQ-dependent sugar dehydrogenase [Desulfobulbaceae bacterium]
MNHSLAPLRTWRRLNTAMTVLAIAFFLMVSTWPESMQQTVLAKENGLARQNRPEFNRVNLTTFDEPWAMAVLPDGRFLITEKAGQLYLFNEKTQAKTAVANIPKVDYGGQGGLGDVILAPDFAESHNIYLSYVEAGAGNTRGAKVIRATLDETSATPQLTGITTIWTQTPKVSGRGHYSHRLLFSHDQAYLYISSGDRQKFNPAQDMSTNLGKVIRLYPDGTVPTNNPFYGQAAPSDEIWSLGHRNILGMQFDSKGTLWAHEMGPRGGDELNVIIRGKNYGWPLVSNGRHYDGRNIPDHNTQPEFVPPEIAWTPVISPSSMSIYAGNVFPAWQDKGLFSGLSSKSLVVVDFGDSSHKARELYRYELGTRIRNVTTTDDGRVYLLEDGKGAHFWRLDPK